MKEIKKDGKILARHIVAEDIKEGLNFFSEDAEYIQVGVWGNYEEGKVLKAHIHNEVARTAERTYEVLYVIKGALKADIYDLGERYVDTFFIKQGEILILLECGHGYIIKENDTVVLEVKNGPYLGADTDRRRI